MKKINTLARLLKINLTLAKWGLDEIIVSLHLFKPFRFITRLNPYNWNRKSLARGEALRKTLEELGPLFVKFGQALSTRPDILPPDIARELTFLQDSVKPFSSSLALQIFEKTFGVSPYQVFQTFDENPLASASMAQVHAATLKSGESVVVKILRPNIKKTIKSDLRILHTLAKLAQRYWPETRRFRPIDIVKEFENHLLDEMDLQKEAANASQLRRNFENSPILYIPKIHWDFVKTNIMVMERIYGIPVLDKDSLQKHHINIPLLAERGVEMFFTQVFRDCYFHADMHPGNIFVTENNPQYPQFICVDFGIMGSLSDNDKYYLAENLMAFLNRDYRRVATLHIESGWVNPKTRVDEFESAMRTVCEPILDRPLNDISFGEVVLRLFQVAQRFQMEIQPQLVLLQKTLMAIEGLGRQLYPELDLWKTAKPILEKWLKTQIGPRALIKTLKENATFYTEKLPLLPQLTYDVLSIIKNNNKANFNARAPSS
jgi:ubiquinone biosynthesis protein